MKSDIEIARECRLKPIEDIARQVQIPVDELEHYGKYIAKVPESLIDEKKVENSNLILVTAITPTKAGIGKTTVSVGLALGLSYIGKKNIVALREPSLGPCFGLKGGAAGGGYAQILPMDKINLHFTGDFHAVTSAHNMIAALLDNYIYQHRDEGFAMKEILWKRVLDINDRNLRYVVTGLGAKTNGVTMESGFDITPASEIMAILCLATDINDLKERLANIVVAYRYDRTPVYVRDLEIEGALTLILKDAIKPNLVQTIYGTPALVHGGPFANIAHGCNSVLATATALRLADYTITEAGFGADLGAEKFLDIKCRFANLKPSCIVLVSTVRSMKYNGGVPKEELAKENLAALEKGSENLAAHIDNLHKFGVPVVVAINHFYADTDKEIEFIEKFCKQKGADFAVTKCFAEGGAGSIDLANKVIKACEKENNFRFLYDINMPIYEKIETIAKEIYGADGVEYTKEAKKSIDEFIKLGCDNMPVCMAKTQYSLSDNPALLGRPRGFKITVSSASLSNGAGFLVCQTGSVMTMPGLSKSPAAYKIDIDENGNTVGLF